MAVPPFPKFQYHCLIWPVDWEVNVTQFDPTSTVPEAVNSAWFGVMLDVGSLRQSDPYEQIAKLLPYAVSWQLKENVWYGEKEVPIDLKKVRAIIDKGGYRGFLPIETLGEGDPKVKVKAFLAKVQEYFG